MTQELIIGLGQQAVLMMVMLAMSLTPAVARPLHKKATKVIFTPVPGR